MIKIPCDYTDCEEGKVVIYGEIGSHTPDPPRTITCPKCKGAGKIEVEQSVIEEQIAALVEERETINQELYRLRRLIFQKRVSEGQKLAWERRKNEQS